MIALAYVAGILTVFALVAVGIYLETRAETKKRQL